MSNEKGSAPNLCLSPWVSVYMHPGGFIAPCCMNTRRIAKTTGNLREDLNGEGLSSIRRQFLENRIPEGCEGCFLEESRGLTSMRMKMAQRFPNEADYVATTRDDGTLPDPRIKHLDIRWSNICNFKCRFCSFGLSSSWAADLFKRYPDPTYETGVDMEMVSIDPHQPVLQTNVDFDLLKKEVLPHVEAIDFLGGEPFLMKEFYQILEWLEQQGRTDIKIVVVSNISKLEYQGRRVLDLLSSFKEVTLSASLDGFGPQAEYLRKGTHWETVQKNLLELQEFFLTSGKRKFYFRVFHTVYALNAFHTVDFYRWINGFFKFPVRMNFCHSPEHFRVDALPPAVKAKLREAYQEFPEFYAPLVQHLSEDKGDYHRRYFTTLLEEIDIYDRIRKESFLKTFPKFAAFKEFDRLNPNMGLAKV